MAKIPDHATVSSEGYELTVHPAFSSRCIIVERDGSGAQKVEKELFRQAGKHLFAPGKSHPKKHVIRLRGGAHARDLEIELKDPKHHVARITVEFYADGHEPGTGSGGEAVESFTVINDQVTCPPEC